MNQEVTLEESLPLEEWHRRHPNEYILYECLEYTDAAEITRSRLLAHGTDKEALVTLEGEYRRVHPDASIGLEWTGPIVPDGWILML